MGRSPHDGALSPQYSPEVNNAFLAPVLQRGTATQESRDGDPRPENGHFRAGGKIDERQRESNNKAKGVRIRATDVHATETELGLEVRQVVAVW